MKPQEENTGREVNGTEKSDLPGSPGETWPHEYRLWR